MATDILSDLLAANLRECSRIFRTNSIQQSAPSNQLRQKEHAGKSACATQEVDSIE